MWIRVQTKSASPETPMENTFSFCLLLGLGLTCLAVSLLELVVFCWQRRGKNSKTSGSLVTVLAWEIKALLNNKEGEEDGDANPIRNQLKSPQHSDLYHGECSVREKLLVRRREEEISESSRL